MIVLDTPIWVWWVEGNPRLTQAQTEAVEASEDDEIGVSIISCWEVAKLSEYGRIELPYPLQEWCQQALSYPGVVLLDLTTDIVVESTQLPGTFHRDPADQLIVATARAHGCALVTSDDKIRAYPDVETVA